MLRIVLSHYMHTFICIICPLVCYLLEPRTFTNKIHLSFKKKNNYCKCNDIASADGCRTVRAWSPRIVGTAIVNTDKTTAITLINERRLDLYEIGL